MNKRAYRPKRFSTRVCIYGIVTTFSIAMFLTFMSGGTLRSEGRTDHDQGISKHLKPGEHNSQPVKDLHHRREGSVEKTTAIFVILVMASPNNEHSRKNIRQTWAQELPPGVHLKFMIGVKNLDNDVYDNLQKEYTTHRDLVLLSDLEESYKGLAVKLMAMFQWVESNLNAKFVMKVDEDSYVRVDKILKELAEKSDDKLYWGFFDGRAHVHKRGKWAEKDYVLCDRYIPYALGGGYVISSDLIKYVNLNARDFMTFQSEDVSLGTWLAPLKVQRIHDPRFDTEFKSRGCYNSYLVLHKQTSEDMQTLHRNLQETGNLCQKEYRNRLSYIYDWSKLPTECCKRSESDIP